jgi:alcohol dehydrogenase class IV
MPYVLAYNRPAIEDSLGRAARGIGLDGFDGFLAWVLQLRADLNIPHTIAGLKVTEDSLDWLAAEAFADPNTPDNPRAADTGAMRRILGAAMAGSFERLET